MSRPLKAAAKADRVAVASAIKHLKRARDDLAFAGADKAADKVRAALKSAEGALRHVERRIAVSNTE